MTFLNPINLTLLGLLGVIAAAYLFRMPRRRLRVPDARVARMTLGDRSRISPQRRTAISLALQLAILALLALSAALPLLGDASRSKRSLIVVLDVSASMKADDDVAFAALTGDEVPATTPHHSRFDKALDAVRGLVRGMRAGDRMMLVTAGRTVTVAFNFTDRREIIDRALDGLACTDEEADFAGASRLAAGIASSDANAEVYLVTDAAVRPEDLAPLKTLREDVVKLVRTGSKAANVGIADFRVRRNLDSPTDYEALCTVVNTMDEPKDVEVELALDGSPFRDAKVNVPARGEAVHVFRQKLHVGGILEARLRAVDALAADNRAWEVLREPKRLRVLLVSDDNSASSFLVRAIASNASAVEGMVITPAQYMQAIAPNPSVLRTQRDAVIFDRWVPEKPEQLPPLNMLAIDCVPPGMPVVAGKPLEQPLIRKWEKGHPLMSYLNLRNVFINSARKLEVKDPPAGQPPVERVAEMVTSPLILAWEKQAGGGRQEAGGTENSKSETLNPKSGDDKPETRNPKSETSPKQQAPNTSAAADDASSAVPKAQSPEPKASVASAVPPASSLQPPACRYVVLAFDPTQSDIVLRKELPLLLWNSFLWFQQNREPATQTAPGEGIALDMPRSGEAHAAVVTRPDGTAQTVEARNGEASFAATSAAGVYRYRIGDKRNAFVVNAGGRFESKLDPVADLGFKPEQLDPVKLAATGETRRPIWPWLLVAAGALLAFEAVVFHRRIYF